MVLRLVQAVRVKSILLPENDDAEITAVFPLVPKLRKDEHGSPKQTRATAAMWAGVRAESGKSFILVRSEGF